MYQRDELPQVQAAQAAYAEVEAALAAVLQLREVRLALRRLLCVVMSRGAPLGCGAAEHGLMGGTAWKACC